MSTSGYSRQPSLGFSDSGDEKRVDTNGGDYSTRMSELFDDDDDDTPTVSVPPFDLDGDDDDDDEEAFVYDGADAQVTRTTYREQLREVLDDDDDETTRLRSTRLSDRFCMTMTTHQYQSRTKP
jgi:hypothetical protein